MGYVNVNSWERGRKICFNCCFFSYGGESKYSGFGYFGYYSEQHVEGDRFVVFFTATVSEARGKKTLSLGAEEGVIITGWVSKWPIF